MSSNANVQFWGNIDEKWEQITDFMCFNKLKSLSTYRGYLDSDFINSCSSPIEKITYTEDAFLGVIPKETRIPEEDIKSYETTSFGTYIHLEKGCEEKYKEIVSHSFAKDNITIYYDKEVEYKGAWYNEESFVAARDKFESKLKEKEKRFYKLSEMKDSIEFFKLDEEACEKLNDEISYIEEDIEELKSKIYICQFMIDLLDYYKYDKKFYKEIKCFICID